MPVGYAKIIINIFNLMLWDKVQTPSDSAGPN